jgi:hypothetical protein
LNSAGIVFDTVPSLAEIQDLSEEISSAHPEPVFVAQVKGEDGGGPSRLVKVVNPGEGFVDSTGLWARESMARCWSNWILVAPTVMATARAS